MKLRISFRLHSTVHHPVRIPVNSVVPVTSCAKASLRILHSVPIHSCIILSSLHRGCTTLHLIVLSRSHKLEPLLFICENALLNLVCINLSVILTRYLLKYFKQRLELIFNYPYSNRVILYLSISFINTINIFRVVFFRFWWLLNPLIRSSSSTWSVGNECIFLLSIGLRHKMITNGWSSDKTKLHEFTLLEFLVINQSTAIELPNVGNVVLQII